MRGEAVAREALEWIGTPFVWGQAQKGVGCDCKGLIQGIARELGFPESESFYATFKPYRPDRAVPVALLREGLAAVFDEASDISPGDVLLLRFRGLPQHLAVATSDGKVVHAQGEGQKQWVKESRAILRECPVDSIWRWRD